MKICIPTEDDRGLESSAVDHFGRAPYFVIAETDTGETMAVPNPECHRETGVCHHIPVLTARGVEAVICSGIGRRAHEGLRAAGIEVFTAPSTKVADIVVAAQSNALSPLPERAACSGHGHGHRHRHPRCH